MDLAEALMVWANACKRAGIEWFLYRETLLCANGYGRFPESLEYAQVAVWAYDLKEIIENVVPDLDTTWKLDVQEVVLNNAPICIKKEGETVLQIDLLWPIECEEDGAVLQQQLKRICKKPLKMLRNRKLFQELFGSRDKEYFSAALRRASQKAFEEIRILALDVKKELPLCCDLVTNKEYLFLKKDRLDKQITITCQGKRYPVFGKYEEYLSQVYGDYENGLTDDIGVGLTVEEKVELKEHQEKCKEALTFLQGLAEKFELQYYLLAGSVLGTVRDGGFIPWDDDIDIGIRVEELEHFEAVVKEYLPKSLPEGFELVQSGANNPYPRMFSKICYRGRCCLDLWPLVPTYMDGMKAKFTWYFAKIITKAHYYKIGYKVTRFLKIVKPLCLFLSDKQVMFLARYNERKYVKKKPTAYINLYSIYKRNKETIKVEWLETPATRNFEGLEVPVVGYTEVYLEHLYGDYMSKPAPWKRASRHVERFFVKENK